MTVLLHTAYCLPPTQNGPSCPPARTSPGTEKGCLSSEWRDEWALPGPHAGQTPPHPLGRRLLRVPPGSQRSHPIPRQVLGGHKAAPGPQEPGQRRAGLVGRPRASGGSPPPRSLWESGAEGSRDPRPSPLPWEPGWRCRNRCRGVSPGLKDSELRPAGNRELSFRRRPPARVSSRRQRELWARRMGAGEGDPARGRAQV